MPYVVFATAIQSHPMAFPPSEEEKKLIIFWLEECLLVGLIYNLADCTVYHSFYDFQKLLGCHSTMFNPT